MNNLPIELKFEISKFLKNKPETFVCYSLCSENIDSPISFRKLKHSYIKPLKMAQREQL